MRTHQHSIQIWGIPTHVHVSGGQGPTVLLLHGGICDSTALSWRGVIPLLAGTCRVIAVDLPGFGRTPMPADKKVNIEFYTGFVAELMDRMNIDRATIAGISMGGMIALSLYFEHPDMVERLVLINSAGLDGDFPLRRLGYVLTRVPSFYEWMIRRLARDRSAVERMVGVMIHDKSRVTPGLIDRTYASVSRRNTVRAFAEFVQDQVQFDGLKTNYMSRLPKISVPVTVVASERDRFYPLQIMERAVKRLRYGTLRVIKNCGHWATVEHPDRIASLIIEAVSQGCYTGPHAGTKHHNGKYGKHSPLGAIGQLA